jgi:peptidoglycan/LPS O-acetylase OafA/YrhL
VTTAITNGGLLVKDDVAATTMKQEARDSNAHIKQIHRTSSVENKSYYRADIDGLRGIAVSLVILFHIFPNLFRNGFLGVDIFFVISGFVVTQSIERHLNAGLPGGLMDFYGHRVKRILPALYANLLATIVVSCLFIPPPDLPSIFKTAASAVAGVSNLALLIASFDYFSPDLSLNPFVHTWSLGAEEQFYLLFPSVLIGAWYLVRISRRFGRTDVLVAMTALSVGYWVYLQFEAPVVAFYNTFARLWELLAGAILYLERSAIQAFINNRIRRAALPVIGVAFIGLALAPVGSVLSPFINIFVVVGAGMLIVSGTLPGPIAKLLAATSLVRIGRLSYSLYLWHYPILTLAGWNLDLSKPFVVILVLLLIVLVSMLSYRFVELPLRYAQISSRKAIGIATAGGVAALSVISFLYFLPPSRIYLGHEQVYAGLWPASDAPLTKTLKASQRECHLEYRDSFSADAFVRCSTARTSRGFVYLVGNSHAQHLIPMIDAAAEVLGYGYSALTISNCRLISATQVVASINYRYDLCKDYFDNSVDFIARDAFRGDVVLVGARSLFDEPPESDKEMPSNVIINASRLSLEQASLKSRADFDAFIKRLNAVGAAVVFVGPTPQFNMPATMCVPEWFRSQRNCIVPVEPIVRERAAYLRSIAALLASNSNAYAWDPLPAFCDDTSCSPYRNGKLLFRDRHHLSFSGSQSLASMFVEFLGRVRMTARGEA